MLIFTNYPIAALLVICVAGLLPVAFARERVSRDAAFSTFNASIGGRLLSATPHALPCFSNYDGHAVTPDPQACSAVQKGYDFQAYRSLFYGNTMSGAWEACLTKHESCLLDYTDPSNPLAYNGTECNQGSISEYYLEVQEASDVIAALSFSNATGIPLSIKNSGHDFFGRSTKKGSLALWMRNLTSLGYHEAFVPTGCPSECTSYQAITAGTAATMLDVYQFADQHNVTAVGGFSTTVAWHGGFVMGGGHGLLSPVYGMAADHVVKYKVVTPDGQFRIANKCQNSDLFWALRGGGGGTFGIVLEATSWVEKQLTMQVANYTVGYTSEEAQEFYEIVVNNTVKWSSEGWGGFVGVIGYYMINPLITLAEATSSLKPLSDFVIATGGNFTLQTVPSWMGFFNAHPGLDIGGVPAVPGSRLIPKETFECAEGRSELTSLMVNNPSVNVLLTPPALFNASANDTSFTPAWRCSLWHLAGLSGWNYNTTTDEIKQTFETVHDLAETMKTIAPNSGSYFNEADVYESNYEESFWGENYPALLKIKQKYDPNGLLDCWRCVGWKGQSSENFECYFDLF
ncbi:hypothetical protein J3A83DRAFT_4107888 [Scleroderma citrinum]